MKKNETHMKMINLVQSTIWSMSSTQLNTKFMNKEGS